MIKKHNLESSPFFVTNIYGQVIKQQSLPVTFDFDQSVPKDKFNDFEKAVTSLNTQLGIEAIRLSYKITSNTSFNNREKDQQNTIYWEKDSNNFLALENPSEQGRASIFWIFFGSVTKLLNQIFVLTLFLTMTLLILI